MEWSAYEQVYGSIIVAERVEASVAQLSYLVAQAFSKPGKRYRVRDFMPHWFRELTADQDLRAGWGIFEALAKRGHDADDIDPRR